jgi:hypothetical protein
MNAVSKLPGAPGQAPKTPRVIIGGQLLLHWLRGDLLIGPPPRRRRESNGNTKRQANGNGTTAADSEVPLVVS